MQPRPSRACRKRRLKKGKGFFAWPRGKESDCNSLRYYTRSLNSNNHHHDRGRRECFGEECGGGGRGGGGGGLKMETFVLNLHLIVRLLRHFQEWSVLSKNDTFV